MGLGRYNLRGVIRKTSSSKGRDHQIDSFVQALLIVQFVVCILGKRDISTLLHGFIWLMHQTFRGILRELHQLLDAGLLETSAILEARLCPRPTIRDKSRGVQNVHHLPLSANL